MNTATELKDTLNLPQTGFPMRANAVQREPERLKHWEKLGLYKLVQKNNENGESFILHDGPPFTNGDVHVGTALNKILKDSILRYKGARGYKTPYIPGWDCHGLPIEHKVSKELRKENSDLSPLSIRNACSSFSASFIEKQRKQFERLGILADWEREYRTMDPLYEAEILKTFGNFVEKGLVYRSKKPVYWSIPCKTALAEAEIEYKDHVSPSVYVKFRLLDRDTESYVVIWTTTPWTLPANLAIAVHPREIYREIKENGVSYWVAEKLANSLYSTLNLKNPELGEAKAGEELKDWKTQHPFIDRISPVLTAEYVTMESGTGCVHIAPGHGLDDYLTGIEHSLEVYCPLTDEGTYVDDGQIPSKLVGVSVLEKSNGCPANESVLEILKETNSLIALQNHHHQYPHCWRSKTPVVFRAMDQWFVSLDQDNLRNRCVDSIEEVFFTPEWGRNRIRGFLESRPDWCISRQRSWGVPIPVFYDEDGKALLDAKLTSFIAERIAKEGTDAWFSLSEEELLQGFDLPDDWKGKSLRKGTDTLDVWIDSGCSHRAVLKRIEDLDWPADLYLEGSDQHRGWFQSSLWTGMVSYGRAPYKRILTHGFVVDGEGRKISKSDGKPQTADSYVQKYGADVLRLWVCSEDFRRDIPLSDEILDQVVRSYRTLRNTLKFQLGTLHDFDSERDSIPVEKLDLIDIWALNKTNKLVEEVTDSLENYEIHRTVQLINRYCSGVLSSTYHDIIKDRLYTLHSNDPKRRSTQTTIDQIFRKLVRLIGPLTPFTSDEAWSFYTTGSDYSESPIILEGWPDHEMSLDLEMVSEAQSILDFKESNINESLEKLRKDKQIGQSLDAEIEIRFSTKDPIAKILKKYSDELAELFIVSKVILIEDDGLENASVLARHASGVRCPRSWRWVPELVNVEPWGKVSLRCAEVLKK